MGAVYSFLGITVGCLQNQMSSDERRAQYALDITYGTNSEFGFDYLRDMGMASSKKQLVQRDHYYAIVDEVDSILIDEARTPLIISGPVAVSTHQFDKLKEPVAEIFKKQNFLCSRLINEAKDVLSNTESSDEQKDDAMINLLQVKFGMPTHKQLMHMLEDGEILKKLEKAEAFARSDQSKGYLHEIQSELFFTIDEKSYEADLTEKGRDAISPNDPEMFVLPDLLLALHEIDASELPAEEKMKKKQAFQESFSLKSEMLHNLSQLLKAYCLYEKDVHYVVQDNKVLIVDEHTGRLMPGRRFSDGLHQALEAKENVKIERETQTLATITIQNYFRLYEKLAGMTGTAETEANEFHDIYKLDVTVIPTNRPCVRKNFNDKVYKTKREKYKAVIEDVRDCYQRGQPVLLGTISVEVSEILSRMLKREHIPHTVLNAKNHQSEADIVTRAGQKHAVTVATNMAGRGTDIKLAAGIANLGGLHVIGSERHDSRRIDRQLRGRCARQGDPGSSRFYVSLEDNLMRLFGSDRISALMSKMGLEEDEELEHPLLNRSIETAQKRVEQHHFGMRKRTLEYDDVMNKQREVIYGFRKDILLSETPRDVLFEVLRGEIEKKIDESCELSGKSVTAFHADDLLLWLNSVFPIGFNEKNLPVFSPEHDFDKKKCFDSVLFKIEEVYKIKESLEKPESLRWLERNIMLDAVDRLWQDHLYAMDHLRSSVGLRAYAQKNPLVEYRHEAFKMFSEMMEAINKEILSNMFRSATSLSVFEQILSSLPQNFVHGQIEQFGMETGPAQSSSQQGELENQAEGQSPNINITFERNIPKVGRNESCPCGSGKKFKKCCGK
jgi:preprotein translocase subunit SecA